MKNLISATSLILLLAALAACGGTSTATPGPAPVSTSDIAGVLWQWAELFEPQSIGLSVVPEPENYTLTFSPDGRVSVKADCNMVSGTYRLDGETLAIELGPSTMAFCGEGSLDQRYLALLGSVEAASLENARLILHLRDNADQMGFINGGPVEASPAAGGADIDPAGITLDTMGLPYAWQANLVPATPYDNSRPPGPKGLPEHVQINFGATDPADKQPGDPVIYIIPVEAYQQLWAAAGDPAVSNTLEHLQALLAERPIPVPPFGLPVLPFEEIAGINDLAIQGKYLDLDVGSGVRFVGRHKQDLNPVTNGDLRYIFQGFSADGKYLITLFHPVTTEALPRPEDVPAIEQERVVSDLEGYLREKGEMLNALDEADWDPNLSTLDSVLALLSFGTGR